MLAESNADALGIKIQGAVLFEGGIGKGLSILIFLSQPSDHQPAALFFTLEAT